MKKIFYFTVFSFFALTGCKEDVEQPALTFPFEIKADPEKIEAGIETLDNVPLTFIVNKSYNNSVTMKYNITSLKKFIATNEKGQAIELNKWYDLQKDTLLLNYKALEQGEHDIKVLFKNTKEYQIEKKINLNFANNNQFTIEDNFVTPLGNIYQGQTVEYNFTIKPLEGSTQNYEVQFVNFDDLDIDGKSTILLNNEKVNLKQWIKINPDDLHTVKLTSYNTGNKKFMYKIRNEEKEKDVVKDFTIKKAEISLKNLVLSTNQIFINEPFNIKGMVEKTNNTKTIQYKTWVSKGDANAVNDTENYQVMQLGEGNLFSEEITIKSTGDYTLNVQARDEFGNESEVKSFDIKVDTRLIIKNITPKLNFAANATKESFFSKSKYYSDFSVLNLELQIEAQAGVNEKISKIETEVFFEYSHLKNPNFKSKTFSISRLFDTNSINENLRFDVMSSDSLLMYRLEITEEEYNNKMYKSYLLLRNLKVKVKVFDNLGNQVTVEREPEYMIY